MFGSALVRLDCAILDGAFQPVADRLQETTTPRALGVSLMLGAALMRFVQSIGWLGTDGSGWMAAVTALEGLLSLMICWMFPRYPDGSPYRSHPAMPFVRLMLLLMLALGLLPLAEGRTFEVAFGAAGDFLLWVGMCFLACRKPDGRKRWLARGLAPQWDAG